MNKDNLISLTIHKGNELPRYYKIHLRLIKLVMGIFPFIALLITSAGLFTGYHFYTQNKVMRSSEPQKIIDLTKNIESLKLQILDLESLNKNIESKLMGGTAKTEVQNLLLFNLIPGFQDLSKNSALTKVENFQNKVSNNIISFSFDIANDSTSNEKLAGYIFVYQMSENLIQLFPSTALDPDSLKVPFNRGERFTITHFRSVDTTFKKPNSGNKLWYKIFIFARNGDLIYNSKQGPYYY